MIEKGKKICIFGAGGFGREVLCCLIDSIKSTNLKIKDVACFMVSDDLYDEKIIMGVEVISTSLFDPRLFIVVVAIGNPVERKKIIDSLPPNTKYTTIIHPSVVISKWVQIGEGSIITAGTKLTCNIKIGMHAHLNLNTTIGHDCIIGDYFTAAPGVHISGNCNIGDNVYFGTNSSIKQSVKVCNNVTIGMGAIVINDINKDGVYIGNPLKQLIK